LTIAFKSKLEAHYNDILSKVRRKKYTFTYEKEKLPYTLQYVPDFVLLFPDGRKVFLEVKGYLRPTDRTKMRAVRRANPDVDIRIVFDKDNKIPGSKMRYSDWAAKNGFPCCFGQIPKDWLK
jgi:hypothetical protein